MQTILGIFLLVMSTSVLVMFKTGQDIFLLLLKPGAAYAGDVEHVAAVSQPPGDEADVPLHLQVIESLRSSSSVIPGIPDVHPVHTVFNREAIIPPQCYTRTEGKHNPCYVCHQAPVEGRENVMNDFGLQAAYSFSDAGLTNHWSNLFEDRSERVAAISDAEILEWINTDNYSALDGRLAESEFDGWAPDLKNLHMAAAAFDEHGFAKDGSHWVAFNYKPLPSTFWPTNGSTDDVMIRLPEIYRSDEDGNYSLDVYRANLAILEATIKGLDSITSLPVDERVLQRDLDKDGKLGVTTDIRDIKFYTGQASKLASFRHMYPAGTEFLHTVRYVGVDEAGNVSVSTRMKEVRYMRKWRSYGKRVYARQYQLEEFEKEAGNLPRYHYLGHNGLDNKFGWSIHGFIEGRDGELRENTFEENMFCMGCHTSIGSTIDKTFSFARKIDGAQGWGYIDLRGMPDAPNHGESKGEILTYFERVGGGDEFRSNEEMLQRWFKADRTSVDHAKVSAAADVYQLITPSRERALELNKAYRVIVEDQDFIFGRDATIKSPINVYDEVDNEKSPTLPAENIYQWDIRLDWGAGDHSVADVR